MRSMPTHIATLLSARQAYDEAAPGDHVLGWKLDAAQRGELLRRLRPSHARTVADHVTLKPGVSRHAQLPCETEGTIVGRADDGQGVQAFVVQIAGSTERPGGGTYHITWSLGKGRRPKESNDVIAARGWEPVDPAIPVRLLPAVFQ